MKLHRNEMLVHWMLYNALENAITKEYDLCIKKNGHWWYRHSKYFTVSERVVK